MSAEYAAYLSVYGNLLFASMTLVQFVMLPNFKREYKISKA